jgi:hypothetical protein
MSGRTAVARQDDLRDVLDPPGLQAIRTRIAEGRFDTAPILASFHRSAPPALTTNSNDSRDVANADLVAAQPTGCDVREPVGRSPEEASWP